MPMDRVEAAHGIADNEITFGKPFHLLVEPPLPFHLRVSVFGKRADVSGATMFGLATGTNDRGDAHYWFEAISDTGYFRVFQLAQPGVTLQLAVDIRKGAFVLTTSRSDDYAFIVSSVSGSVAND
jgi:hypothetical protein